ncbi:hypothetical protein GQR58_007873 [Nymphon striatum]|nr:hypothetical protein GQR58_007873 [Nymphon striatum]
MKSLGFFCFFFFFFLNIYIVFRLETGYADDKFESINSKHIELGPATLLKLFDRDNEDENKEIPSSTETLTASTKILPSPEEMTKATAEEYPAKMVPIDVTGAGFQRMSNFRRSLLKITFLEKRKKKKKAKRRNTICEGESGSSIKKEVQDALTQTDNTFNVPVKRRSMGLFNLRRKSADMLESSDNIFLSGNLKKTSISTSCQTEDYSNAESQNKGSKKKLSTSTDKENLSGPNKFFRGFLRSTKLKSLKNSTSSVNKESVVTKSTSNKKGNSVIPISTLSQAMNVAVKMRDGSIRTGTSTPKDEDRNSSSGNWSASSSTRTSFDSDCINKNSTELALSRVTSSCTSRDSTVSEKDNRNCGNWVEGLGDVKHLQSEKHDRSREVQGQILGRSEATNGEEGVRNADFFNIILSNVHSLQYVKTTWRYTSTLISTLCTQCINCGSNKMKMFEVNQLKAKLSPESPSRMSPVCDN